MYAVDRVTAFWAMLAAAVTRLDAGESAFQKIRDPFGDGPFRHRPRGDAFDLISALNFEGGQPVVLSVGE